MFLDRIRVLSYRWILRFDSRHVLKLLQVFGKEVPQSLWSSDHCIFVLERHELSMRTIESSVRLVMPILLSNLIFCRSRTLGSRCRPGAPHFAGVNRLLAPDAERRFPIWGGRGPLTTGSIQGRLPSACAGSFSPMFRRRNKILFILKSPLIVAIGTH